MEQSSEYKKKAKNREKHDKKAVKHTLKSPTVLKQPVQSYMEYEESVDNNSVNNDFEFLMNAPTSVNSYYISKYEKNESEDVSQCYKYFTLDLKLLSAAIDCIPFNELIDIEDKYLTDDQLTSFHNTAEKASEFYATLLNNLNTSSSSNVAVFEKPSQNRDENTNEIKLTFNEDMKNMKQDDTPTTINMDKTVNELEEDLDFLLSLKSPVSECTGIKITTPISTSYSKKIQSSIIPSKPSGIEDWLDSVMLDD